MPKTKVAVMASKTSIATPPLLVPAYGCSAHYGSATNVPGNIKNAGRKARKSINFFVVRVWAKVSPLATTKAQKSCSASRRPVILTRSYNEHRGTDRRVFQKEPGSRYLRRLPRVSSPAWKR